MPPRNRGYVSRGEAEDGLETWLLYVMQLDDDDMTLERVRSAVLDMIDAFSEYPKSAECLREFLEGVERWRR